MKNKEGLITTSIGLIFIAYDFVSNHYEFYGYKSNFCLSTGSVFILFGLIIILGKYIYKKTMNFYGDFDKLGLVASDLEQLKVLLKGNNWYDRAIINFDFDKHKPVIEKSSISIPFITSNKRGIIKFYIMNPLIYIFTIILLVGCNSTKKQKKEANNNETEWVSLFDGETFNGWHIYNGGVPEKFWIAEEGVLKFNPPTEKKDKGRNYNIVTDDEYTNFELSLEWKISEGGNSGIFWGVVEDPDLSEPYYTGPEVQILDIDKAKYDSSREKEDEFYQPGALYDLSRPSEQVAKPAGMWNHVVIHINHEKNHGHVVLNSVKIHEFPISGVQWEKMIAGSKFKDWSKFGTYKTGKIGLQDHGNPVAFKNIKIKNLRLP